MSNHIVLKPHSELITDVDAWLIAEHHSRSKRKLVSANQIRPFVTVHPHAVTHAMGEVLVVRTESGIGNHFARSGVH